MRTDLGEKFIGIELGIELILNYKYYEKFKKSFLAFIAAFAVSCGDPELPVELFPEMEYGAYARKMSQTGEFNTSLLSRLQ